MHAALRPSLHLPDEKLLQWTPIGFQCIPAENIWYLYTASQHNKFMQRRRATDVPVGTGAVRISVFYVDC